MSILRDANSVYLGIVCDADGCETVAPPAAEVLAGHGLNNMGWECHGGTHMCPQHAQPVVRKTNPPLGSRHV